MNSLKSIRRFVTNSLKKILNVNTVEIKQQTFTTQTEDMDTGCWIRHSLSLYVDPAIDYIMTEN